MFHLCDSTTRPWPPFWSLLVLLLPLLLPLTAVQAAYLEATKAGQGQAYVARDVGPYATELDIINVPQEYKQITVHGLLPGDYLKVVCKRPFSLSRIFTPRDMAWQTKPSLASSSSSSSQTTDNKCPERQDGNNPMRVYIIHPPITQLSDEVKTLTEEKQELEFKASPRLRGTTQEIAKMKSEYSHVFHELYATKQEIKSMKQQWMAQSRQLAPYPTDQSTEQTSLLSPG